MSNKDLDNLFKNKLEDFGKMPSTNLWNKIEDKLEPQKKKKTWFVLSIAATVTLLFTFAILLFQNEQVVPERLAEKPAIEDTQKSIKTTPASDHKIIDETKTTFKENSNQLKMIAKSEPSAIKIYPIKESNSQPNMVEQLKKEDQKIEIEVTDESNSIENEVIKITPQEHVASNKIEDATIEKQNASTNKETDNSNTMVFDISQFEKNKAVASVTEEVKKESRLKKIIDKAMDLKEGESGLGELRAAKNDLFAFNSKKGNNDSK